MHLVLIVLLISAVPAVSVSGPTAAAAPDTISHGFPSAGPFLGLLPSARKAANPGFGALADHGDGPASTADHAAMNDPTTSTSYRGRIRGEMGFSRREKTAGVAVALIRRGDPTHLVLTSTGENGFYQARGILEGEYRIVAYRDGIVPETKEGINVRGPFRSVVDVTLRPGDGVIPAIDLAAEGDGGAGADGPVIAGGSFFLKVIDPAGAPRAGARVVLRRLGGGVDPFTGETGSSGAVSLASRPDGRYSLRVESPGHISVNVEPLVLAGSPLVVQVFLVARPGDYAGSVLDLLPEERPIAPSGVNTDEPPAAS